MEAEGKKLRSLDLDRALMKMVADAEATPPVSAQDAAGYWSGTGLEGYYRWKKIFAPDSAFDDMKTQAGL